MRPKGFLLDLIGDQGSRKPTLLFKNRIRPGSKNKKISANLYESGFLY